MFNNMGDLIYLTNLPETVLPEKPLAMAYIRNQTQLGLMDTEQGFSKGTIFAELYKPFNRRIDDR